jgi:hypothetical protein
VVLSQGSTFVNKQCRNLLPHLWVIVSDPTQDKNKIVIVNVSTWRDKAVIFNDPSCIIENGEHSFIKQKSYIVYKEALIVAESALQDGFKGGVLTSWEDCSTQLLEKILTGATVTQHLSNEVIGILQEQGIID